MSVGIQKQEHFMQRRRGDEGGKAMETHIALVWTKASISHCEQMNIKLGIMDGRRLYSIICLPLSTIERLTNHEKEVQKRSSVRHLLPFAIVSYQSQNCSSYRVPRVQTSSTLSALTGLWWGLSLEVEELSREKQTCDQKQAGHLQWSGGVTPFQVNL